MKIENVEKFVPNMHNEKDYVVPIRNLKQALNHGLVLTKVNRAIKFNREAWFKPYIDMNTELQKVQKVIFSS